MIISELLLILHQLLEKFMTKTSTFQHPVWVVVFALTAAIAWGWAFPLIKVGFSAFGITANMTGGKMLFAGIRFAAAGLIVLSVAREVIL